MSDEPLTAAEIHELLDPFIGTELRIGGTLGRDAFLLRPGPDHLRIVDEDGDDVAFVGHRIDAALMAAAPRLARQLLVTLERVDYIRRQADGIIETEGPFVHDLEDPEDVNGVRVGLARDVLAILDGYRDEFVEER